MGSRTAEPTFHQQNLHLRERIMFHVERWQRLLRNIGRHLVAN